MKLVFNSFGEMVLEESIRSIADINIAGQFATDGVYYCIHVDHLTGERYALSRDAENKALSLGRQLDENEQDTFNGEEVRGMTFEESLVYNEDRFDKLIDLWGNIMVE